MDLTIFRECKFRHDFQDTLNAIWSCGDDIQTTNHYLLYCTNYLRKKRTDLDNFQNIGENIHYKNDFKISEWPIKYSYSECYYQYVLTTKRFNVFLTSSWVVLKDSHFWKHMITLLSPTIVHTELNDNKLFISFWDCPSNFSLPIF